MTHEISRFNFFFQENVDIAVRCQSNSVVNCRIFQKFGRLNGGNDLLNGGNDSLNGGKLRISSNFGLFFILETIDYLAENLLNGGNYPLNGGKLPISSNFGLFFILETIDYSAE